MYTHNPKCTLSCLTNKTNTDTNIELQIVHSYEKCTTAVLTTNMMRFNKTRAEIIACAN